MKRIVSGITLALLVLGVAVMALNMQSVRANGATGDLNDDGVVNFEDLKIAAAAFGSYPGHSRWNSEADLNGDEVIDGTDMGIIARQFGVFLNIPEYWLGTVLGLVGCFAAFGVFRLTKRKHL